MSRTCDNGTDLRPNDVIGPPRHSSSPSRSATKRKNLRVLTVNCQSLRSHSKHLDIAMLVQKYNPDVINATETHLNMDITNSELGLKGYDILRCDRVGGMVPGGGVLVATGEDLLISPTSSLHTGGLEAVLGKINISGSKTLHVGCVYRQPNNNPEPINTLAESLISTTPVGSTLNMLITGDFNFPDIDWDIEDGEHKYYVKSSPQYGYEANEAMLDLINQHSLSQFTDKPTRGNNILDLVLSIIPDSVSKTQVVEGISDQSVVITDLNLKVKPTRKVERKIYIYKKADIELLKDEITSAWDKFQTSQPHDRSVEQNWCHFTSTGIILTAIRNHVPTKTISGRWNLPCVTPGLRRLIRKKQRVYNLAKRTQNPQHWKKFQELRKTWKRSLLVAHNDNVLGLLDWSDKKNSPSIGKKFWTYIKSKRKEQCEH